MLPPAGSTSARGGPAGERMKFDACGRIYTVVAVEGVSATDNPSAFGYCNQTTRQLEIRGDQSFDAAYETLAHEFGHACELAGVELYRKDPEKRINALATIACSFARQYHEQGGDDALIRLLGLNRASMEIELATPEIDWANLTGPDLYSHVLRYIYCRKLSDSEFATYRAEIEALQLNPFVGECYPIRNKSDGTVKIGIKMAGLRRLCREFGGFTGSYEWCGPDGVWKDVWLASWGYPDAARCPVRIKGDVVYGVAQWDAYAERTIIDGQEVISGFWHRMGYHMLALCAERLATARVIPPMSNVVVAEEMQYRPTRRVQSRTLEPRERGREIEDQRRVDEDEPTEILTTDDLHNAMNRIGVTAKIVREGLMLKVHKLDETLREDNFEVYAAKVMAEARRQAGR